MNRGRLRDLVRKRLGETTTAFWTDQELNDWLNDAGHQVAYDSKCIRAKGYMTSDPNQEYSVSAIFPDYLSVTEVYFYQDADTWYKLTKTTRDLLNFNQPGWKSAPASVPQEYYWDREEDVLGLNPKPNDLNQGVDYIEVYYANDFTDMSGDTQPPGGIPEPLQLAMIDFVVATGYETRGWGDKANDAWQKYSTRVRNYMIERDKENNVDDESLVMRNYRNR